MKKVRQVDLESLISRLLGDVDRETVARVLKGFKKVVVNEVKAGNSVYLLGFGKFESSTRHARGCNVPRTGKRIRIPELKVIKFRVARRLKNFLKNK